MRTIDEIVQELKNIPLATKPPSTEAYRKPPRKILDPSRDSGGGLVQIDIDDQLQYPAWIESELFGQLDQNVQGSPESSSVGAGLDALAWYVSFHHADGLWGIFIPVSSLAYLEHRVFAGLPFPRGKLWEFSLKMLCEHERMHFAVD